MAAENAGSVGPEAIAALPLNVKIRIHGGKTIVGGYQHFYELTESAAFIWRQIDGTRTVHDIGLLVAGEYDIDKESATQDVAELLTELAEHDVIKIRNDKS
ncbi:PqqD family protein [Nocardia sp. NPDC020380]|uniref:PqqD family protein n=1 Tax=Nocardia sp. NPDC020380 TaxID=3364309 RepID=UPI0037BC1E9D